MTLCVVYNGASGGLGRHLGPALGDRSVAGWALSSRLGDTDGIGDELDQLPVEEGSAVTFIQSAGMVPVDEVEQHPDRALEVNVDRTGDTVLGFTKWALVNGHQPRIVFVSSGHVYAPPIPGERLVESSALRPRSVYAESKLAGEHRIRDLAADQGAGLVIGRVFGMIGPSQRPNYLVPGLIRRIGSGDLDGIPGLDYIRDYLDARDVAHHLVALATLGSSGADIVNVCSGEETRIGDLLDQLLVLIHGDDTSALEQARGQVSAAPGRATDIRWSVGDPTLLAELVGEQIRSIPLATTLADSAGI